MSKYHNPHQPESVVRVIQTMNTEEIEQEYGVELDDDGSVWDVCEGRPFGSLAEWALFMDECESAAVEAASCKGNVRYGFDDD